MRRFRAPFLPDRGGHGWTPYAWLFYLVSFFIAPIDMTRAGTAEWWLWPATLGATALFLVTYFRGYWLRGVRLIPIAALHTALGIGFAAINPGSSVFFVYAAAFVAQLDRPRDAMRGIALIALLGAATAPFTYAPLFFAMVSVVITLIVGGVNLHYAQEGRSLATLRLAHAEIEQLAAIAERERIARDLHDVLGHTLSLIVLKAELAVKLSEIDPARAAREMRDVEQVARSTLHDVRHAIRGYQTTLPEELDRARSMLKAARVAVRVDAQPLQLAQPVEEALALALREAVTNVVRHSGATACRIRVAQQADHVVLEVHDDGRGPGSTTGLGLRGMRERVESLRGTLSLTRDGGALLVITLPAQLPARTAACATTAQHTVAT